MLCVEPLYYISQIFVITCSIFYYICIDTYKNQLNNNDYETYHRLIIANIVICMIIFFFEIINMSLIKKYNFLIKSFAFLLLIDICYNIIIHSTMIALLIKFKNINIIFYIIPGINFILLLVRYFFSYTKGYEEISRNNESGYLLMR